MNFFQAIVYGVVQGLTEFLPVSSSAHLILVPFFTDWPDPGLAFDVALHLGTLVAVVVYFRRDVAWLIENAIAGLRGKRGAEARLPWLIAVATVPGALIGVALEHKVESVFRSPWVLVGTLPILGLLLWLADRRKAGHGHDLTEVSWGQALFIGFAQGLAVVPGVSRSGITITAALFAGLDRPGAVRFSFLMSIPIIFGAGLLELRHLGPQAGEPAVWIAMAASALSGFAAIAILIRYVRTRSFTPFVIYRILLAVVIAAVLLMRRS